MKILITGSSGLVGSACVELFEKKGWKVIGIDNNSRAFFFGTPLKKDAQNVDITNFPHLEQIFQAHKFDAIIHAAAQPSHDWSTDNVIVDFMTNAMGTVFMLELTRKYCPEATFVHVSTDKVYGENMQTALVEESTRYASDMPFAEDLGLDFAGHRSFFGCSKTAADIYAQEYANEFGMKVGIFRPGCITGKNHEGAEMHGFLAYLAQCIKDEKTYKIFGNGKNVRDQIHASDLASAFHAFVENPRVGAVYNIGGGSERSISVLEAGEALSKEIGKPFKYEFHEARKGDRLYDVHDISKFRADFPHWDYEYSLKEIIEDFV